MSDNCNNCGKYGHISSNCYYPITSYGVILFKLTEDGLRFLMVRRKCSFSYIDFIYGNYINDNNTQIQYLFDEMSLSEHEYIKENPFQKCYQSCWDNKKTDAILENKFNGVDINFFINNSTKKWKEPEWDFPKGKKNNKELDLTTAIREFKEETGFNENNIEQIENILPFEEIFMGSNFKSYKTKYFLFIYKGNNNEDMTGFQKSEIGDMNWKSFDECIESIRDNQFEKINLIKNVNQFCLEFKHLISISS
jgi:8-oxo-dGTP pyrophosphatase MutT (NUDIX family)